MQCLPACTSDAERFARLRLARTNRIGPVHVHQLVIRFGIAVKTVENLPLIARCAGGGIVPAPIGAVEAEIERGRAAGARLVVVGDATYPGLLAETSAAPPVLSMLGEQTSAPCSSTAIVGAQRLGGGSAHRAQPG